MKSQHILIALLTLILAACAPGTSIPTATLIPVATSTPLLPTPTATLHVTSTIAFPTPSPLPTQRVFAVITPDQIQMERWDEYEDALATTLFPPEYIPQSPNQFLCEWEILGRSEQEIYVWATCMSIFPAGSDGYPYHGEIPAVIHIGANGAVQSVEIPRGGSEYASDIRRMFPPSAQERYFDKLIPFQELTDHLRWRRDHPDVPPLIVLSAMPTATLTP